MMVAYKVRIVFESEHAQSPVYICGSFTSPPWIPMLMQELPRGINAEQRAFWHDLEIEEGRWEYKIRIGESGWVCDEAAPKVVNEQGFANNILIVGSHEDSLDTQATDGAVKRSSGRSVSWELVQKNQIGADRTIDDGIPQLLRDDSRPEIFEEPEEDIGALEAQQPVIIDCQVAEAIASDSPRAINIKKRVSSAETAYLGRRHSELSLGNTKKSTDSRGSLSQDSLPSGNERRRSFADIERVRYIMAMPREDGSSEPPTIMAYQGSQIMQLSPDYMTAIPIAADGDIKDTDTPFVPRSRFSSDLTISSNPGASSTDSVPQSGLQHDSQDCGCTLNASNWDFMEHGEQQNVDLEAGHPDDVASSRGPDRNNADEDESNQNTQPGILRGSGMTSTIGVDSAADMVPRLQLAARSHLCGPEHVTRGLRSTIYGAQGRSTLPKKSSHSNIIVPSTQLPLQHRNSTIETTSGSAQLDGSTRKGVHAGSEKTLSELCCTRDVSSTRIATKAVNPPSWVRLRSWFRTLFACFRRRK